jgi:hypothetical protein
MDMSGWRAPNRDSALSLPFGPDRARLGLSVVARRRHSVGVYVSSMPDQAMQSVPPGGTKKDAAARSHDPRTRTDSDFPAGAVIGPKLSCDYGGKLNLNI